MLIDGPLGTTNDGIVVTRYEYDRLDRLTFTTEDDDDEGRTLYDGASRVIETVDPELNVVESAYDDNPNLIEILELDAAQLIAPATLDGLFLTTCP